LGLLAVVGVVFVITGQDDTTDVKASLSWKDLGVPEEPHRSQVDEFIAEMSEDLDDNAAEEREHDCLIHKNGYQVGASGKACCDDTLLQSAAKCMEVQKGCTVTRMAKIRASFNQCLTKAEGDCDSEAEAYRLFVVDRAQSASDQATKKKQLKSMAAAASSSSELMFAALTAVSTDKDSKDPSKESSEETPMALSEDHSALKTHFGMQKHCMDQKVAQCHTSHRVKGAKVRSMAVCKAKHGANVVSCHSTAKAVHAKCVEADATADYFPKF